MQVCACACVCMCMCSCVPVCACVVLSRKRRVLAIDCLCAGSEGNSVTSQEWRPAEELSCTQAVRPPCVHPLCVPSGQKRTGTLEGRLGPARRNTKATYVSMFVFVKVCPCKCQTA